MRKSKPASASRGFINAAVWFFLVAVFAPLSLYVGIKTLLDERDLRLHGLSLNARVTAFDRVQTNSKAFHLKYSFTPDGIQTYSCADQTATLRDLWCPVTPEQFALSEQTHLIEVVYLPRDPWINRPRLSLPRTRTFDASAMIFMGVIFWAVPIMVWLYRSRSRRWLDQID
jgi:hypothetical protein